MKTVFLKRLYRKVLTLDTRCSKTTFSFKDAFPSVSLCAKKLKLFVNDSNSKDDEIDYNMAEIFLNIYVQNRAK